MIPPTSRFLVLVFLLATSVLALEVPQAPNAKPRPDLSPKNWDPSIFAKVWDQSFHVGTTPTATINQSTMKATSGVVSGSADALGMYSGVAALNAGGNAMDACVATSLAQATLASGAFVSHAGIASFVYHDAASGTTHYLDGTWRPAQSKDYANINTSNPAQGVLVGGFMKSMEEAAAKYGKLDFKALLDAAIYFAEEGAPITNILKYNAKYNFEVLNRTEGGRQLYDKLWLNPGSNFTQPEMGSTLRCVQENGSACMYDGVWSTKAAALVQAWGGLVEESDYKQYTTSGFQPTLTAQVDISTAKDHRPAKGTVYLPSSPNYGGRDLWATIQVLSMFKKDATENNIASAAWSPTNNMTTMGIVIQLVRWEQAVDALFLNNATRVLAEFFPFIVPSSAVSSLAAFEAFQMSDAYVKKLYTTLKDNEEAFNAQIESLFGAHQELQPKRGTHSDAVTVSDAEGNTCSIVHTINSEPWGSGLFAGGIALSDAGLGAINRQLLQAYPKLAADGALIPSGLQNIIWEKETNPTATVAALSTVGSSLSQTTSLLVASVLFGGTTPFDAMNGPQFRFEPPSRELPPIPVSAIVEITNCSSIFPPVYPSCKIRNEQNNCFTTTQLRDLPDTVSSYVVQIPGNSMAAYGQCGLSVMSWVQLDKTSGTVQSIEGVATPCINGWAVSQDGP